MIRRVLGIVVVLLCLASVAGAQSVSGVSLVTPAAGAMNVPLPVILTWTGGDNATSYEVKIGTSNHPTNIVAKVTTRTYTAVLAPATKYYWRITARNARGTKTSSSRSFTTGVAPLAQSPNGAVVGPHPRIVMSDGAAIAFGAQHEGSAGYRILRNGVDTGGIGFGLQYRASPDEAVLTTGIDFHCHAFSGPSAGWQFRSSGPCPFVGIVTPEPEPGPEPKPEFCSDRIDNDGDGLVDENCSPLPPIVCAQPPPNTTPNHQVYVTFEPALLDHYNNTDGYVLEIENKPLEDLGKPAADRPLPSGLQDYRVYGCVTKLAPLASALAPGSYQGYVRACRSTVPPATTPNPMLGYAWCSIRSAAANLQIGTSPTGMVMSTPSQRTASTRRYTIEFFRSDAPGKAIGVTVARATLSFQCRDMIGVPITASPDENPTRFIFGPDSHTECAADISKTVGMLAEGSYVGRVQMGSTWSAWSRTFTVER